MEPHFSSFANSIETESAFDVLAVAKRLIATGKDVIELEIGDSPFPSSPSAVTAGIRAIENDECHYGPSAGLPQFRQAAAEYLQQEYDIPATAENIVAGPGAKNFEQLFLEAFVDPHDGVLVFSPHFPTYPPNILRRNARMVLAPLKQSNNFRPNLEDVRKFLDEDPQPKAIFLNTPQNPTGGVATAEDLEKLADLIRDRNVYLFSDEPYDQMVWNGKHHSPLALPGMLNQCVGAYTFSKSFSMSGWRLGFAVSSRPITTMLAKLTNTSLSCIPPFTQLAGIAALQNDLAERDRRMQDFQDKVRLLVDGLNQIDGIHCLMPGGSFYAFPAVAEVCNRLEITSHGLAMYLLEAADDQLGVACLGGECFGDAGHGFVRFSVAQSSDRLRAAIEFIGHAVQRVDRVATFLNGRQEFRLSSAYTV